MAEKIIIYQVLPRLFGNKKKELISNGTIRQNGCGKFSAFTLKRLGDIRSLGATHIWFTGVLEHATMSDYSNCGITRDNADLVKGLAGSPYAIKDYYDVDPDLADKAVNRMKEFERLVSRAHRSKLKVIIDFVPNHVARKYHSDCAPEGIGDFGDNDDVTKEFSPQNNFYYLEAQRFKSPQQCNNAKEYIEQPAKATGNDCFSASPGKFDWFDTVKLNYGVDYIGGKTNHFSPVPDTWLRMLDILKYWSAKGVDGFRCDMSEMVPVEFWHWAVSNIKRQYPNIIFIAEIYNPWLYESYVNYGGFDYLYDKVGLYDKLRSVITGFSPANEITQTWQCLGDLQPKMLNFIENHDEQRLASDFFAGNAEKGKPAMIVAALMNVNPVMVYFGQEYGERGMDAEGYSGVDGRTSIYDYWAPEKISNALFSPENLSAKDKELRDFYAVLLGNICKDQAISEGKFFDLTYCNQNDYSRYPSDKLYSFIRKKGKSTILAVANFHSKDINAFINIPSHAFDYLNISPGVYNSTNLLCQETPIKTMLSPECSVKVSVPAFSGVVLRFTPAKEQSVCR